MGRPPKKVSVTGAQADLAVGLRTLAQQAGLDGQKLAARTGLSTSTISRLLSGDQLPSTDQLEMIVQACGAVQPQEWSQRLRAAAAQQTQEPAPARRRRPPRDLPAWLFQPVRVDVRVGPAPVPVTAQTVGEFMTSLELTRIWAGEPSFRTIASRIGMPASSLHDALHRERKTLPPIGVVADVLRYYGIEDSIREYLFAWHRVRSNQMALSTT